MKKTTNYNLSLYEKADKLSITAEQDSLNHNMELIDSALAEMQGGVPTKTSELINDSGFITSIPSTYATNTEVNTKISTHNTSTTSHNDIRLLIEGLTTRLNTLANSDDTTLDQMSEVVAYIKSNRDLIEGVTTNKVNVADIINNLTTNVTNKPLSAAQGVVLKNLIDTTEQNLKDYVDETILGGEW